MDVKCCTDSAQDLTPNLGAVRWLCYTLSLNQGNGAESVREVRGGAEGWGAGGRRLVGEACKYSAMSPKVHC